MDLVHLRYTAEIPTNHPQVYKFLARNFIVRKSECSIPTDQAHEQNNASVKGDWGALDLLDNPGALLQWTFAGPEVSRIIQEFEEACQSGSKDRVMLHHKQSLIGVQVKFARDVQHCKGEPI